MGAECGRVGARGARLRGRWVGEYVPEGVGCLLGKGEGVRIRIDLPEFWRAGAQTETMDCQAGLYRQSREGEQAGVVVTPAHRV